jgi:hypothetical protein
MWFTIAHALVTYMGRACTGSGRTPRLYRSDCWLQMCALRRRILQVRGCEPDWQFFGSAIRTADDSSGTAAPVLLIDLLTPNLHPVSTGAAGH